MMRLDTGGALDLTVIVPVYNEERTIHALLERVIAAAGPRREVIVVNDGSSDGTAAVLQRWRGRAGVRVVEFASNRGKGAAVRAGLELARGEVTIIQDGDLEYDPRDYTRVVTPILRGEAEVVFGSRYLSPSPGLPWTRYRLAVLLLNGIVRTLYGLRLTDEATCYKAVRTDLMRRLRLEADRFELCPEMTAKLARMGVPVVEVPISYRPRSRAEGKKIRFRDAVAAVWTLFRWRWRDWDQSPVPRPAEALLSGPRHAEFVAPQERVWGGGKTDSGVESAMT
ncbi:MAG: glycosyltransferase family 2 protein [Gemmataceae bacterium]